MPRRNRREPVKEWPPETFVREIRALCKQRTRNDPKENR